MASPPLGGREGVRAAQVERLDRHGRPATMPLQPQRRASEAAVDVEDARRVGEELGVEQRSTAGGRQGSAPRSGSSPGGATAGSVSPAVATTGVDAAYRAQ